MMAAQLDHLSVGVYFDVLQVVFAHVCAGTRTAPVIECTVTAYSTVSCSFLANILPHRKKKQDVIFVPFFSKIKFLTSTQAVKPEAVMLIK